MPSLWAFSHEAASPGEAALVLPKTIYSSREFLGSCGVCQTPIERKYSRCWKHRNTPLTITSATLPLPPPRERKPRNHHGRRTDNVTTLN